MRLDPITSLADLEFKAKTNKYYKQLAILGAEYMYIVGTKPPSFEEAMDGLCKIAKEHNPNSCGSICATVNEVRNRVKEDVPPRPPIVAPVEPAKSKRASDMLDAGLYADVIVELKKNLNNEAWAQLFTTIAEPHPFPDEERRQRERSE